MAEQPYVSKFDLEPVDWVFCSKCGAWIDRRSVEEVSLAEGRLTFREPYCETTQVSVVSPGDRPDGPPQTDLDTGVSTEIFTESQG